MYVCMFIDNANSIKYTILIIIIIISSKQNTNTNQI